MNNNNEMLFPTDMNTRYMNMIIINNCIAFHVGSLFLYLYAEGSTIVTLGIRAVRRYHFIISNY